MHLDLGRFAGTDWAQLVEAMHQAVPGVGKDLEQPEEGKDLAVVLEDSGEGKELSVGPAGLVEGKVLEAGLAELVADKDLEALAGGNDRVLPVAGKDHLERTVTSDSMRGRPNCSQRGWDAFGSAEGRVRIPWVEVAEDQERPLEEDPCLVCWKQRHTAGTKREPQRAAAFYRKSASLGDTAAMYKLGVVLLRGTLGEQPNAREAVGWLRRAAEQADVENPHALHELAMLYENPAPTGGVVPLDPQYAKELYTRAGLLGYAHSQFRLGQCYEHGNLACAVDPKRSIAWYTKAAEKGHSEAELSLSGWYLTGSEGVLKQSDSEAYLWARRAANKGLSKAEYAVGYYAEVGIGVKQDIEFAKRWYMRAAGRMLSFLAMCAR